MNDELCQMIWLTQKNQNSLLHVIITSPLQKDQSAKSFFDIQWRLGEGVEPGTNPEVKKKRKKSEAVKEVSSL